MEINTDIEKLFSRKFSIQYYEKTNKIESGNMNFSGYEIMIQGKAIDGKIKTDKTIAYPDISNIILPAEDKIVLDISERNYQLTIIVEDPLYVIKCIFIAFKLFFPCEDVFCFLPIKNESKLSIDSCKKEINSIPVQIQSPCNNFSFGVKFFAKYKYLPENDEIIWDIDTVYANKETHMFVLKDFDHLKPKYLLPVLGAMCYNTYFSELSLSFVDLTPYEKLLERVFKMNKKFKKLYFENCNLKLTLCATIAHGLEDQKSLISLNLSNNEGISDRGIDIFIPFFKKSSRTLEELKVSRCGLSSISLSKIADAFTYSIRGNEDSFIKLKVLDLSHNLLRESFKEIFFDFLSKCLDLENLNLSNMNCSIEMIAASLLLGPVKTLKFIDLSENLSPLSSQSCTQWSTFFKEAKSLMRISISNFKSLHCSITDGLMLGLEDNVTLSLTGVEIILSNSNFNTDNFSKFSDFIYKAKSVTHLDISSNGIGVEIKDLLKNLPEFCSLKSLNVSSNFTGLKQKEQQTILTQMTAALQLESVNLQELYMSNCNFGTSLSILISELDSFFSLRVLDISGNNVGNVVARTVGRMLTIDKHIKEIMLDNNNISKEIYEEILDGLAENYTLSVFHVPFVDLVKYPSKMVLHIIEKINKHHIKVNKIYQGVSFEDIKTMAFSCIMNQTSENIDKCKTTLQESCNRLRSINPNDEELKNKIESCLQTSLHNIKTIEASKDLSAKLNYIYKNNEDVTLLTDLRIKKVMETICNDVFRLLNDYMNEIVDEMMNEIGQILPYFISNNEQLGQELKETCRNVMIIPKEYLIKLFSRFIENNLLKKVYETQSNVTNALCDNITDHIITQMNTCDIQANRLINSINVSNQLSKITKEESSLKGIDKPVIRSTDDKKVERDKLMSVRTSRLSHLSASKARPLSKALHSISDTLENEVPVKAQKPSREKLVFTKQDNYFTTIEEPNTPEEYSIQSMNIDQGILKPMAPSRTKRLNTVTETTNDNSNNKDSMGKLSSLQSSLTGSEKAKKDLKLSTEQRTNNKFESQDSITESLNNKSSLKSRDSIKKNLSLTVSTPTGDMSNIETSKIEEVNLITSLKSRAKPLRNFKPKVYSPTITSMESNFKLEEGLTHFHTTTESEPEKASKLSTKKKPFFSLTKSKATNKSKSKAIDLNDLGNEHMSNSDSDIEGKPSNASVKIQYSKDNSSSKMKK